MVNALHQTSYQIFREMLLRERLSRGVTQVEMASRLGKPQSYVSKYERGERRLDFTEFLAIADILELDIGEFIRVYQVQCQRGTSARQKP